MAASGHEQRNISNSQFGDNTSIYQGNVHLHLPHLPAHAEVVRVIPYPRNEDLVYRQDLINKLDKLLPQTPGFYSAALWGLGGSGKTQIALDYAYRRCDDSKCCVFWVHADSEATFITDYKIIGKKLGVDERLNGLDLLDAVRSSIEAQSRWVIILDNADNLELFGVGCIEGTNESLSRYIPRGSQGTILWTSRDAHIRGTLVGPSRDIKVPPMTKDEATTLLAAASGDKSAVEDAGIHRLLEELQRLPLAVSQAGAYIRRTSMTIREYLGLLMQGSSRWDLLKMNDFDRHRRPEVSNSVLETWKISTKRIREESELSYRILHVIAYLDSQDIPYELIVAASQYDVGDEDRAEQVPELEVQRAVMRLVEFSFLDMRRGEGGLRNYEMHKLVQEAVRYGLWVQGQIEMALGKIITGQNRPENGEAYYSSMALQIVDDMFPGSEKNSWARCEKYMTHAIRVGEWAEVSKKEVKTSTLLSRVSVFLYDRGRWREREPVDRRVLHLRRELLGEKHPDTIRSMADLATTYHAQGRYDKAKGIYKQTLDLQREVLGEKHPDTIRSMANLAAIYGTQGRYNKAEGIYKQTLDLQREVLGEKHPDTIKSMAGLAATYHAQGRYNEAEGIKKQVLDLQREVLGEKHPDTIWSIADLAATYSAQGRYNEAEGIYKQTLDLQREVLGEKHPDTIWSMADLATTYHAQGRYNEAEGIYKQTLDLQREVLGEKHPDTIRSMADLATTYHAQGRYNEAEGIYKQTLDLQREVLGEKHPDTIRSMADLAATYGAQG
ncbi:uncharacterized protein TRIVIDRAFT_155683 [Trichoderma virens Gv29-8]|uniref:Uncharacterized protein n=1 Tax=Hypocrea virens (strain Gv29-8 / FGSC 10586) TaxID=413071 RepID=G9N0J5_HYPVG|nr:uncharacterized protein TRIVIDRAFT_155683 [Trichoderma virens Gv29-8]EHK19877.1 hypothetical protein TRIVIDRAFT_155683 [Trichoderma virens Gv29-8]